MKEQRSYFSNKIPSIACIDYLIVFQNDDNQRHPVLFLGAKPSKTPSFYSFMNFADFGLGTWHPRGGMYEIVKAMGSLAEELGVKIQTKANVDKIIVDNGRVKGLSINGTIHESDIVLSGADYHHSETLLDSQYRQYSESYWKNRTFAPSSLLFYVGFDK
ncbi:MAG: FAD-dependent oxidoreductase, partial [Bacteroidota bacterium]